jgi:hypothetical protein
MIVEEFSTQPSTTAETLIHKNMPLHKIVNQISK